MNLSHIEKTIIISEPDQCGDAWPSAAFFGVDGGPRETLEPLAAAWGARVIGGADSERNADPISLISNANLVVVGTSESTVGREFEGAIRTASARRGVPLVAIEDYPGNYNPSAGAPVDMLIVESQAVASLAKKRCGPACPRLEIISPARFDNLRRSCHLHRTKVAIAWNDAMAHRETSILWVGQPETDDAITTLQVLLPIILENRWKLMFRAHPRDSGCLGGAYQFLKDALRRGFVDVTGEPSENVFLRGPALLITQFSSMVVEAGFFGIPSLCILLPRAGEARLMRLKGYSSPVAGEMGAVAICRDPNCIESTIQELVGSEAKRREQIGCFDEYYQADSETLKKTLAALMTLIPCRL